MPSWGRVNKYFTYVYHNIKKMGKDFNNFSVMRFKIFNSCMYVI